MWSWTVQWCDAVRSNIILLFDFFDYFYFEPLKYIFLVELEYFHCSNLVNAGHFINNICVWWYSNCFILSFSLRHGCPPPPSPLSLSLFSPPPHSLKPFFLFIFSLPSSPLLTSSCPLLPPLCFVSMTAGTKGRSSSYYYLNDVISVALLKLREIKCVGQMSSAGVWRS